MAFDVETIKRREEEPKLGIDFTDRLEAGLPTADRDRRRHVWVHRLRRLLPACLLIGPFIGWRLILASPGTHVYVDALSWIAFVLDVGVHVNTTVLSYLGLRPLPLVIGVLLFVLLTLTLLKPDSRE